MPERAYLYPDADLGLGSRCFPVNPAGFDIGRQTENGLSLQIDSVSRRHARVEKSAQGWIIRDLGSSNGTYVNGEQVEGEYPLRDGDIIVLGKATLTFHIGTADDQPAPCKEHSSGLRLVADEDSASIILSTRTYDQTPFKSARVARTTEEHLDALNRRLLALYHLSDVLRGATRREAIITALMDLVFENLPADRGVALRYDEELETLEPELFRFHEPGENHEFVISRTITNRALKERVAVLSRDVHLDKRFQSSESLLDSDTRSAMCIPLAGKRSLLGLIFFDSRESVHAFTDDDLAFVSALATDAAMTLENLELVEENIRQERLAAVGQTISGLAHNIKNILQLARGSVELMDGAISKQNFNDIATLWPITRRSIDRMQTLTQEMLDFSRQSKPKLGPCDVNELVTHMAELIRQDQRCGGITVHIHCSDDCGHPTIDSDGLCKALMNLLSNALDALHGSQNAEVHLYTEVHRGHVVVRLKDNGPGIPPEILPRIFQPFFSTKGSKGNGLGLSMTRKYIEDMGGKLDVRSEPDQGAEFIITLPAAA